MKVTRRKVSPIQGFPESAVDVFNADVSSNMHTWTDSNLDAGSVYEYKITVFGEPDPEIRSGSYYGRESQSVTQVVPVTTGT